MSGSPLPPDESLVLHATAVALEGRGLLILGRSGAGKSGLALRLLVLGARLVADDRVLLTREGKTLMASAPAATRGLIEARGFGLLRAETVEASPVAVAVDLERAPAARMPHPREIAFLGVEIELMLGHQVPNLDAILIQLLRCGRGE